MRFRSGQLAVLGIAMLASVGAGYFGYGRFLRAEASTLPLGSQIVTVERRSLASSVSTTGSVVAARQAKVSFTTGGRLKEVLVRIGQQVKKGQELAYLEPADLQVRVELAESALRTAQLNLQQLQMGATNEELAAAEANYASALARLDQVRLGPTAEELASVQATYESALVKYNQLLAGPSADDLAASQAALEKARATLQKAQTDYDKVAWRGDIESLPQSTTLQQATADYQSALAAYNLKVVGATPDQIKTAEASLHTAKNNLDLKLQGPTVDQIRAAEASVASTRSTLEAKRRETSDVSLALQYEKIRTAELNLQQARVNLDNATLRAPFDGIVANTVANVGEQVGVGTTIVVLLDPKELRIDAMVDEADIVKVKKDQVVQLTVDALSDSKTLAGKVLDIAGSGTMNQGVVTYPVYVGVTQQGETGLKAGMTVGVNIVISSKDNVLRVPNRAIRASGKTRLVDVLVDGKVEQRVVQVGVGNDQYSEIVSGLQQGEQVVIRGTTTAQPRVTGGGLPVAR